MTKKHYITLSICALLIVIGIAIFGAYYRDYIKPESYSIGVIEELCYKKLAIKDYLSDENVLFSQNINDVSFSSKDGISTYEYNFDAREFNGEDKDYLIYVNNYMINNLTETAGTVGGTYNLNYYDIEKQVLCSSAININFSFYSLQSKLKVTLNSSDLGYLMNYFKTDNFIITLAENPFVMNNQDVVVETSPKDELAEVPTVIKSVKEVTVLYDEQTSTYSPSGSNYTAVEVANYTTKVNDEIQLKYATGNTSLVVDTDGTYTSVYNSDTGYYVVTWENASYVTISINKTSSSGGTM